MRIDRNPQMMIETPQLSPDFAAKVLRAADATRLRWRVAGWSLSLAGFAALGIWLSAPRLAQPQIPVAPAASLVAADFTWLEEVGATVSSPGGLLFPEPLARADDSLLSAETEENL